MPVLAANPYALGVSLAVDSAEGRSFGTLVNYSASATTTLWADLGLVQIDSDFSRITNHHWNLAADREFKSLGVKLAVGQWGDESAITSNTWSAGVFKNIGSVRLSLDYVSQDLDVTFRLAQDPERQTRSSVKSSALDFDASVSSDTGRAFWISASKHQYDRPVTRLGELRTARLLSPTSLSLASTLLDHSVSVGMDLPAAEQIWSFSLGRDRTAVDRSDIDSVSVSWLTPVGARTDLEIGLGASRNADDTQFILSFLLLRYGGID